MFVIKFKTINMQIQKDDINRRILVVARKLFITNGVRQTSMRQIACNSGIAVSNIYNYFQSKDELFRAVLTPLLNAIDRYVESHNQDRHITLDIFELKEFQEESIRDMLQLIKEYKPELRLLFFHAETTSLEGYKDKLIERQYIIGVEFLKLMKRRFPQLDTNISPFMLRVSSNSWMMIFLELLKQENIEDEVIRIGLNQWSTYSIAGWKKLMNVK